MQGISAEHATLESRTSSMGSRTPTLSARQAQVLAGLARGLYYKEIAAELGISHNTVAKHCGKVLAKLGADNSREAIWKLRYCQNGTDRMT